MLDPLPQPQKALPHSEESERAVLAAVLIHPPLLATVSGRLTPEDFYVERHGLIYQAMLSLQEDSVEVDLRTLQAKLEQRDQLDAVGGVAYLAGLDVDLPDLGRLDSYVDIVKERSVRRRLIDAATAAIRHSLDGGLPAQEALGLAEQAILSLGEETVRRGFVPLGEVLHEAIEEIEERPGKALTGLPTGFVELDATTRGLNPGNLIIIAGRPGMGKSSFSTNLAQYAAIHEGKPVGIFSLEMGSAEIARRILASEADVPSHALVSGHMSKSQWQKVVRTARRIDQAPLLIDDSANPTLLEIASKARRLRAERGLELIIVDYLQLMQAGGRYENRNLELGAISRGLKQLAKELNIPVIALSQLSRQPERRGKDHRPQLADLRECVPAGTLVCLANGERIPIERLVGTTPEVVAISESGRLQTVSAEQVWSVGVRRILRVTLASGRQFRATADHRLLGAEGWVRIRDLAADSRIATVEQDAGSSVEKAENDLSWDRVVEVVDDGEEEVFDLTVPGPNCWLADGIVSHNSGNLEQDADMVAFIYREEVYDPENPEVEGIAEFIIAKHRNGALGRIRLAFLKETTTFKNLTRGDLEPPSDVF